jgi:hypothetical protein
MTLQPNLRTIDPDLGTSIARSFLTALAFLGDANKAEAFVAEAIETLDPGNVTCNSVRDALIRRLVEAQIGRSQIPASANA